MNIQNISWGTLWTPLEACASGARFGNRSVFILDLCLRLGDPKCFYGEKLTMARKVTRVTLLGWSPHWLCQLLASHVNDLPYLFKMLHTQGR